MSDQHTVAASLVRESSGAYAVKETNPRSWKAQGRRIAGPVQA